LVVHWPTGLCLDRPPHVRATLGVTSHRAPQLPPILSDNAIRAAKPREKPYKLFDERGLFMLVTPKGARWWRLKFRVAGKERLLSVGVYPDASLKAARERRDELRCQLADGVDPSVKRKVEKAASADSFEAVAREWFTKFSTNWAETHSDKIIRRLEKDVFP